MNTDCKSLRAYNIAILILVIILFVLHVWKTHELDHRVNQLDNRLTTHIESEELYVEIIE